MKSVALVLLGVASASDPICNSAGCTQYKFPKDKDHPKDYFVPDFGIDPDIASTQAHEHAASGRLNHTWTPTFDIKKDEWVVPHEDADFKLLMLDSDPNVTSLEVSGKYTSGRNFGRYDTVTDTYDLEPKKYNSYVQLKNLVVPDSFFEDRLLQLTSDPQCSSSGWCGPHSQKDKSKEVVYPMGPLDSDILDS